jgi:uncharacterized protein (TIRG00374 family)
VSFSSDVWRIVRTVAGLGLLAYVVSGTDWSALRSLLTTPWLVAMIVALPAVGALLGAARLRVLSGAQGVRLPLTTAFQITTISAFFNLCIPGATGGDVVKMWYLSRVTQQRPVEVAAIWFVDRLTGVFALLILLIAIGAANLSFVAAHPALRWLLGGAIVTFAALLLAAALGGVLVGGLERLRSVVTPLRDLLARGAQAIRAFRHHPAALVEAVGISFIGHGAMLATFVAIASFLLPSMPPGLVSLLVLFGMFANAVPLTRGGVGGGETAFDPLFRWAGAAGGAGLLLVWRIGLIPFCVVGWLMYVAGVRRRKQPADQDRRAAAVAVP